MKLRDGLASCNRLQRRRGFKIILSLVMVALHLGFLGFYTVAATSSQKNAIELPADVPSTIVDQDGNEITNPSVALANQLNGVLRVSQSPANVAVGVLISLGVVLLVIWMGLFLSYMALNILGMAVCLPMIFYGSPFIAGMGMILLSTVPLIMSFAALMQGLGFLYSFSYPVFAIARNVLSEALRMKISLIFIVLLILMMSVLPLTLDPDQSLRYRVQSFLRYSTGISFWLVALLVVFFGAATVSFEQREKVIWQTMTKPVAAWQYLLGKWLGIVSLAAVLLGVSMTGAFYFTDYLRKQTAEGETAPYVTNDQLGISADRLMLETQVLAARRSVLPSPPFLINDERFDHEMEQEIASQRQLQGEGYNPPPYVRRGMRQKLYTDAIAAYFAIDPRTEGFETYVFDGLQDAKRRGAPLTLRFKIDAEGNRPDLFYALTFFMEDGSTMISPKTGLGFSHTKSISPDFISETGRLRIDVFNGYAAILPDGSIDAQPNANTASFPADGFEVSYVVGSFLSNYIRIIGVLWVKLALLAMLAVWASTFTSFPVACLLSVSVFFIGESAGFVQNALPGWGTTTLKGEHDSFRYIIYHAADWISSVFTVYNDLNPTARLADGRVLPWSEVSQGVLVLGVMTAVFYFLGVIIFRGRQLAMYSGQ